MGLWEHSQWDKQCLLGCSEAPRMSTKNYQACRWAHATVSDHTSLNSTGGAGDYCYGTDQKKHGLSATLMCCRTSRAPAPQKPLLHQRFLQPSSHAGRPSCSSPTPPHRISCLPVHTEALAKPSMELQCCATLFLKK